MRTTYEIRQDMARVAQELFARDISEGFLGTLSARTNKGTYLVKPQTTDYPRLKPLSFVEIDIDGRLIEESPTANPAGWLSLNWFAHEAAYRTDRAIGAVIHGHDEDTVALISQSNPRFPQEHSFPREQSADGRLLRGIPLTTEEAIWCLNPKIDSESILSAIPIVEDVDPATLAGETVRVTREANYFAIRRHGFIAVGRDIDDALGIALVMMKEARIMRKAIQDGGTLRHRTADEIREAMKNMPPHFRWRSYNKK